MFAGRVRIVCHSPCRTSAILKYFCPLQIHSYIWPLGYKTFKCSTKHEIFMLIKTKILTNEEVSCFKSLDVVFILLKKVKMPTIVGILKFMSRIFSCSAELSMKKLYTSSLV